MLYEGLPNYSLKCERHNQLILKADVIYVREISVILGIGKLFNKFFTFSI